MQTLSLLQFFLDFLEFNCECKARYIGWVAGVSSVITEYIILLYFSEQQT